MWYKHTYKMLGRYCPLTLLLIFMFLMPSIAYAESDSSFSVETAISDCTNTYRQAFLTSHNLSVQKKEGLFFLRAELGTISSIAIGYGGVGAQVFINAGYGLVRDEDNTYHLGLRNRISIGARVGIGAKDIFIWNLGLRYGFLDVDNWNGQEFTIDLSFTKKNWDFLFGFSIAGPRNSEAASSFNPELTYLTPMIGVGYTFRSKKYWDYRQRREDEYSEWLAPATPSATQQNSPQHTTPCPNHKKSGMYFEYEVKRNIDNANDGIVGIYERVGSGHRLGVIKNGNDYSIIYMSGLHDECWEFGHIQAELNPSATYGVFKGNWYGTKFVSNRDCVVSFDGVTMHVALSNDNILFLKMYPTNEPSINQSNEPERWSGTGWALGNGYIVTNNHVVEGANTIMIKGIDGNLNIGYSAQVVATDKVNDLAIIKINDGRFSGYGTLPYGVSYRIADVGEDVFVLGYPLGQFLGDEIKLTTGIINSRTGAGEYQNCYQIQAPITNGNSGGPVFDSKGNVIGIVVAGLNKELNLAENVGYAIKTSYLKILIESDGLNITFPSNNTISTLSRPEKVKRVKNFVYYIECSK